MDLRRNPFTFTRGKLWGLPGLMGNLVSCDRMGGLENSTQALGLNVGHIL